MLVKGASVSHVLIIHFELPLSLLNVINAYDIKFSISLGNYYWRGSVPICAGAKLFQATALYQGGHGHDASFVLPYRTYDPGFVYGGRVYSLGTRGLFAGFAGG